MKKYILGILASLLLVSPVYAYTVKQGDTLWGLFGSKWNQIAELNGISNPTKLQVGQELKTDDLLGAAIPSTPALIDTYLASAIAKTDTQMTLANGYDRAGNVLTGLMCFTIDVNTPSVEYTCGTASGTLIYNLQRGLNLSNPNVTSSALAFPHRRLATVQVTDYPSISILSRMLNGQDALPNHLIYTTTTYTYGANQLVTWDKAKDYTDYVGAGGFTSANVSTTRGLSVDGSVPEKVGMNVSTTLGGAFDSSGKYYQKLQTNGGILTDSNGLYITTTSLKNAGIVSTTASAGLIPQADSSGLINSNWIKLPNLQQSFVAGENITAGDALILGTGNLVSSSTASTDTDNSDANLISPDYAAQTYLSSPTAISINSVRLKIKSSNVNPQTITVSIYNTSGGAPTSTAIEGKTASASLDGSATSILTFTFSTPVTISTNTTYAIVVTSPLSASLRYASSGTYAGGNIYTNNGSTWTSVAGGDAYFGVDEYRSVSGRVYKSSANQSVANEFSNNFIGFANSTATTTNSVVVNIGGIDTNQTGMTTGTTYYLSNTYGAITSTAGVISRKIGLSISSTAILIKHDNP